MFGYTNPAPAPALAGVVSKAMQAALADPTAEEKIQPLSHLRNSLQKDITKATQLESRIAAESTHLALIMPASTNLPTGLSSPDQDNVPIQDSIMKAKVKVVKAAKPSISSLDDIMDLLENEAFVPSSSRDSRTKNDRTLSGPSVVEENRKKAKAGKPSISSLDEMMSLLEQDWDISSPQEQNRAEDQNRPRIEQTKIFEGTSSNVQTGTFTTVKEETTAQTVLECATIVEEGLADPKDDFSALRKVSFASSVSSMIHEPESAVGVPEYTQAQSEDEAYVLREKSILDCMKEVEDMRTEREQMELERQRMLEEELAFRMEAERFAAEEEQMRRLVENLKREKEQDIQNQRRKGG